MPYVMRERKGKIEVVNPLTGAVKGTHKTKRQAMAQMRALYANVPDAIHKRRNQVPANSQLWMQAKNQAKSRFAVYPSAYANMWAVQWYKDHGGTWKPVEETQEESARSVQKGMRQWIREESVDITKPIRDDTGLIVGYQPCSEESASSSRCMPKYRAMKLTDEERKYLVRRVLREAEPDTKKKTEKSASVKKYGTYRRHREDTKRVVS